MDNNNYIPKKMIILYKNNEDAYAEQATINADHSISSFKPMNQESILELNSKLIDNIQISSILSKYPDILPENIIHCASHGKDMRVIWYTQPMQQTLLFDDLGIKNGKAWLPALLWDLKNNDLSWYALHTPLVKRSDITLNTQLYKAPFHNTDQNGSVCLGTLNITTKDTVEKTIKNFQDSVFKGEFTHLSDENVIKGNLNNVWKELIDCQKKFPPTLLVKSKIIKQLFK